MRFVLAVFILLLLPLAGNSAALSPASEQGGVQGGTISGRLLTRGGEPLAGGSVYFFSTKVGPPPDHEKYWRVPDVKQPLDADGAFSLLLPVGTYYMGATRRLSGRMIGPPHEGDYYFISTDDKGAPLSYDVRANARLDLGVIAGGVPFRSSTVRYGDGITAIEGHVLDRDGQPVAGALVLAFVSAARGVRPLFISEPTGRDGQFVVRVAGAGSYYLKVRSMYGGGRPVAGEMFGIYGEKQPEAFTISQGERLTGFTLRVTSFAGRGAREMESNGTPDQPRGR